MRASFAKSWANHSPSAEAVLREFGFAALRVNGSMRDQLLNKTLFLKLAHARVEIAD